MNCKSCDALVEQKFCPNCGLPAEIKRIDATYIIHEIEHLLHLEKGIFYTIKELLIRPGESVKSFISENRNRLVKPIIFIIVTSLFYSLINYYFHIEDQYVQMGGMDDSATSAMLSWVQGHYGYANIMMGIFIALWLKLFFLKHDYNIFEITILLCFVIGIGMLFFALFALVQGLTNIKLMTYGGIVGMFYCFWAIGQFYGKRKVWNYIKAIFAYLLGSISFYALIFGVGFIIDTIFKD